MKDWKTFTSERVSNMITLSREGLSMSTVLPWDTDADEMISAFVRMLWVAEYPPAWFPDILRELAENIEIELGRNQEKPTPDETNG